MQGTYFWSTGQTSSAIQASQSGTYSVTVTDLFGCVSDATTEVVEVLLPIADFSTFILGYGVRFTNLSQNATGYVWNFGDGRITTQESPDHIYDWPGGTFTVTLTVFNECDTVTKTIEVTVNREVGINSMNSQESFNVYPNPNNGQFNLEINSQKSSVFTYTITDLSGKQIVSSNIGVVNGKHVELISLNNVSPGFYFVKVKSENAENVIKISVQ
jgi:PKD repeat protein